MSYYRRGNWNHNNPVITEPFAPTSTTPYQLSLEFVKNEFFNLDVISFYNVLELYSIKYGDNAGNYMRRTYHNWRLGITKISQQTQYRILECVPPFLSKAKQFQLLSFYISSIIDLQKNEIRSKNINISQLTSKYREIADSINKKTYQLDWFIEEIFTAREINEFIDVLKFTIIDMIKQSYDSIYIDMRILNEAMACMYDEKVEINYNIKLLNCNLDIDKIPLYKPDLDLSSTTPLLITKFKDEYHKFLVDHAINMIGKDQTISSNQQVLLLDMKSIIKLLDDAKVQQEYDLNLSFIGCGGRIEINIKKRSLQKMQYIVYRNAIKSLAYVIMTLIIYIVTWHYSDGLFCVGIYLFMIPLALISSAWTEFQKSRKEVKEYESKRAKRFTTD